MVIAIENKIGADLYNPLDIYKEHIDKGYSKLNKKCIVLTAHRLSNEEQKKANEKGFVVVLYKKLFDNVRELLGKYVSSCNPNFLSFMLDFMMTVEKRMNFMDNTELNRFFFDKKEEIESMLNSFGDWQRKLRDEQSCELNKIKDVITKKNKMLMVDISRLGFGSSFLRQNTV